MMENAMTSLHTDSALLKALEAAAKIKISADELRKQRVSFIMGALGDDSSVTRAKVTEILAAHELGQTAT